jgi:hypothetical protein
MSEVVTMESPVMGIDAIKEVFGKVKEIVDNAAVVMEDGKVGFSDLTVAPAMFMDIKDLVSAAGMVGDEAKDLSSEEIKEVLALVIDLGMHIAKKLGVQV